ncbi:MAG: tetratricopeptide repeat protein [Prolixibacteraceae bacterium]|nr:tetratricopeptide repeat protein [Prolixibacteraceae bacterium]
MRSIVFIIILILGINSLFAQQQNDLQSQSSLAISYYNANEYEKALPLLLAVYERTKAETYFRYYLNCLLNLDRTEEAELQIEAQIDKQKSPRPEFYVSWGHVLKAAKKDEEAIDKFETALSLIKNTRNDFLIAANAFISWGEYEYAKQTYLKGREVVKSEQFNYELARIYLQLRDYENMLEEYLNLVRLQEDQLSRVQSALSSALRLDIDDELRDQFRSQILRRIQSEPSVTGYNRLLIWFFLQEKKFAQALRQAVALDRRTGTEDIAIIQLGNMALNSHDYTDARNAFDYLMNKGEDTPYYRQAYILNIRASYNEYITNFSRDKEKGEALALQFKDGLNYLGYSPAVLDLIRENAHLLAFHLDKTDEALEVINKGLKIPQLKPEQEGELKAELGDIYVYADDPWEAALIYSQAIEKNNANALGDEIKLKKAKLAYYTGNFEWAKTQLDVLKGSTSKLTANDAMELSLLIGNNLNLDTTAVPLTMFSKADLLFFQNKGDEAMVILDGLTELFPYNSLVDEILFRKAKIEIENNNDSIAAEYLTQIIDNFSYDLLGDDAMFLLAELYDYQMDKKEEAKELYRNMLSYHPGSIYIEESRTRYRDLRELYPDDAENLNEEDFFIDGIINADEF